MRFVAVALLTAGLAVGAAAAPQPKVLLGTKGNVVRIAADGSRVALITTAVPKSCDRIVLWDSETRAVATWQTSIDCAGGATSGGQSVTEVAVAGQRVAWVEEAAGNLEDLQLKTAVPGGKPKEVDFAENGSGAEEAPDGDYLGNLFGQGSLLVYNTWSLCALIPTGAEDDTAVPCGNPPAQLPAQEEHVPTAERLWRFVPKKLVRRNPDVLKIVGVDAGRIAAQQASGAVTIFGSGGAIQATIAIPPGRTAGTVFQGSTVATLRNGSLEAYDVSTGKLVRSVAVPEKDAVLRDVQDGIAVYVAGVRLHLVRLSDGKQVTIVAPGHAPVDAQLDGRGFYYSYNLTSGSSHGRVVFLPTAQLKALFG